MTQGDLAVGLVSKIRQAEARLRLPDLARKLGLELPEAPGACLSPFRNEKNPSFNWFVGHDGKDRWKDFASGEHGDSVDFIVKASGILSRDAAHRLIELARVPPALSANCGNFRAPPERKSPASAKLPPKLPSNLHAGAQEELAELVRLRGWGIPPKRLQEPTEGRQLMFGTYGGQRSWLLIDRKGEAPRFFEARKMDGTPWAHGAKSLARGSKSALGVERLRPGDLALVLEGAPDYLAAHVLKSEGQDWGWPYAGRTVPVSILGAGGKISHADLESFKGVRVLIVPHLDSAGSLAAKVWGAQLEGVAAVVNFLDLTPFVRHGGKDLADCLTDCFAEKLRYRVQGYFDLMGGFCQ